MKKLIALILMVTMIVCALVITACGKKETDVLSASLERRSSKSEKPAQSSVVLPSSDNPISSMEPASSYDPIPSDTPTSSTPTESNDPIPSDTPTSSDAPISSDTPTSSDTPIDPVDPNAEKLVTTEDTLKNGLYISDLKINNAGTYYLGAVQGTAATGGGNYVFKVQVVDGANTYDLDIGTVPIFTSDNKQDGDLVACGTNNYFNIVCRSLKTKIEANSKTFSDGTTITQRLSFGGAITKNEDKFINAIAFKVESTATVKIWWVAGDAGRQMEAKKGADLVSQPSVPAEVTALIDQINAIGTVELTTACNDKITAAETAYSALAPENQALVTNYQTLVDARTAYNELQATETLAQEKVSAFKTAVAQIETYTFTPEYKTLLGAADTAYAAVPTTHTAQVETEKATLEARKSQYAQDEFNALPQEVKDIVSAIDAIGEINATNYLDKETTVATIETNYAALTPENQAKVTNYQKLTDARQAIEGIKAIEAEAQEKIANFKTDVSAITVVELTDTCKQAIDKAYATYATIPATHTSLVETEKATLDGYKAQYDELGNQALVTAFRDAVNAIGEVTLESENAINAAQTAYDAIPATHTAQVVTEKATLDTAKARLAELKEIAANQAVVDAFMAHYNYVKTLALTGNVSKYEEVIAEYEALNAKQVALITDATVATNIADWKAQIAAMVPAEPVTKTFSFENDATGWTSSVTGMTFGSGKSGKCWKTSSAVPTATFETTETYNAVTYVKVFVLTTGSSGGVFDLYIGDEKLSTHRTSSTSWGNNRIVEYSGTAKSGKIKIIASGNGGNKVMCIDECTITYTPAN